MEFLPFLITCNQVINEEDILKEKKVKFSFEDGIIKEIIIDDNRRIHENKSTEMMLIEIFPEIDNINNFLEMEQFDIIRKAQSNKNADIYILQYGKSDKPFVTFGKMNHINNPQYKLDSKANEGRLGSPILLLETLNVIAMVQSRFKNEPKSNEETSSKNSGGELNQNKEIKNEISLKVIVDENNIDEDIYIINAPCFIDEESENNILKGYELKEINENNVLMFINGKETKFEKHKKFDKEGIYSIDLKFKINLTEVSNLFFGCIYNTEIYFKNFNTDHIKNMNSLFFGCTRLINLDLSSFDTKNIETMNALFAGCCSLKKLDLSNFNTKNVINMGGIFHKCYSLTSLDLSNFNTENVKTMNGMFNSCLSLEEINLSSFNTKNVEDMSLMFCGCENLKKIDLANFDTRNAIDLNSMFTRCIELVDINLSSFDTKNVNYMMYMFSECCSLINLDLSSFDTRNVSNMNSMFKECNNLTNLNISSFNTGNVIDMCSMFERCISLEELDLSSFDTRNVINITSMFFECYNLKRINLSSFDLKKVETTNAIFFNCKNLINLPLILKM